MRPRREGRIVFYSLDDQHIISIFKQTLQHVEEEKKSAYGDSTSRVGAEVGAMTPGPRRLQPLRGRDAEADWRSCARLVYATAALLAIVGCGIGMLLEPAWWVAPS